MSPSLRYHFRWNMCERWQAGEQPPWGRINDLGQVHMDALRDQQPNLGDIDADMPISCNAGEAQTQEPAQGRASSPCLVLNSC